MFSIFENDPQNITYYVSLVCKFSLDLLKIRRFYGFKVILLREEGFFVC